MPDDEMNEMYPDGPITNGDKKLMEMTKKKTDFEKLMKERNAAVLLRDEIAFIIGFTKVSNPEISEGLEKALKNHEENRVQEWL